MLTLPGIYTLQSYAHTNTHIGGDKAGSFDEGATDVEELPECRTRQVTVSQRQTDRQQVRVKQ